MARFTRRSKSDDDDDDDGSPGLTETVDVLAKRTKFHEKGIKPEIFNGLHIPLILRELHVFLKAPVAGGLGTQVRCFVERDRVSLSFVYLSHLGSSSRPLLTHTHTHTHTLITVWGQQDGTRLYPFCRP